MVAVETEEFGEVSKRSFLQLNKLHIINKANIFFMFKVD